MVSVMMVCFMVVELLGDGEIWRLGDGEKRRRGGELFHAACASFHAA